MSEVSRRENNKTKRRTAILDAARAQFANKGLQATKMEEIAEMADVSKGTIYLYFETKDDLYVSVILDDFMNIEEQILEIFETDGSLFDKGKSTYLAFIDHCMQNTDYIKIAQYFLTDDARKNMSDKLIETVNEQTSRLIAYVARMVQVGIDSGFIREEIDPKIFSLMIWRMTGGLLELVFSGDTEKLGVGDFHDLFESAYDVLMAGIRKPAQKKSIRTNVEKLAERLRPDGII